MEGEDALVREREGFKGLRRGVCHLREEDKGGVASEETEETGGVWHFRGKEGCGI